MKDEDIYRHDDLMVAVVDSDAIHIRAVTPHGDPVELNEEEASELVAVLQKYIQKLRDTPSGAAPSS